MAPASLAADVAHSEAKGHRTAVRRASNLVGVDARGGARGTELDGSVVAIAVQARSVGGTRGQNRSSSTSTPLMPLPWFWIVTQSGREIRSGMPSPSLSLAATR